MSGKTNDQIGRSSRTPGRCVGPIVGHLSSRRPPVDYRLFPRLPCVSDGSSTAPTPKIAPLLVHIRLIPPEPLSSCGINAFRQGNVGYTGQLSNFDFSIPHVST